MMGNVGTLNEIYFENKYTRIIWRTLENNSGNVFNEYMHKIKLDWLNQN